MIHSFYALCIGLALVAGTLGGILADQAYISKPAPEVVMLTKKEPMACPASTVINCNDAIKSCKQTIRDRMRGKELPNG